jgi:hypothetical protein
MDQPFNTVESVKTPNFVLHPRQICRNGMRRRGRDGLLRPGKSTRSDYMSRRPARFTQADLNRALKAIVQSGAHMMVEIIPDGTLRISPAPAPGSNRGQGTPEDTIEL